MAVRGLPKTVRACALVFAVLSACVVITACGSGSSSGPPYGASSLTVNVTGVPSGTTASVIVTGPAGFSQTISQTTTLTNLTPGAYSFAAPILPPASSGSLTVPTYSSNPVTVSAGATATSTVAYGSLPLKWQAIGPKAIQTTYLAGTYGAGQIGAVAVNNATPSTIYVACAGYTGPASTTGVYKTTDGGTTWTSSNTGLTDPAVAAVWVDQSNPNILVAGTMNTGLFRSTDAAATWQVVQTNFGVTKAGITTPGQTTSLLQVGTTLYAGTAEGVAMSQDEGATWSLEEPTPAPVGSLAVSGTYIYAALLGDTQVQVVYQSAPGAAWGSNSTPASLTWGNSISADPANALHAIVVEEGYYQTPDLWETFDGGHTWQVNSNTPGWGGSQWVAFDPSDSTGNTVYTGGDYYFYGSNDSGLTWTQLTSAGDLRTIVPQFAGIKGMTVAGSDQGIYSSTDGGNSWTSLNGDLTTSISYWVDISGKTIFLAMQDYAPIISFDGGSTWKGSWGNNAICGEGGLVLINPGNPQYVYFYSGACGFWVSADGGVDFQTVPILNAPQFPSGNGQVVAVDSQSPAHVYAAAQAWNGIPQGIYESTDNGIDFVLKWPTDQVPSLIAFDPTNDQNIFIGAVDGSLQVSHDSGKTWTTIMLGNSGTQNEPVPSWPVSLSINPANPNLVMVGMSGPPQQNDGGVLISSDGGNTFTSASTGLGPNPLLYPQPWPDPLFAVAYDSSGSGLTAAARWDGIYLSSDNGAHWVRAQGNALPLAFTDVKWANGDIYATTFGEGVVQLPVKIQARRTAVPER